MPKDLVFRGKKVSIEDYRSNKPVSCPRCGEEYCPADDAGFRDPDRCLGRLEGVLFACCGHGSGLQNPYVAFSDRSLLSGDAAVDYFEEVR